MSVTPSTLEGLVEEIKNRESADAALQAQIDKCATDLSAEIEIRLGVDVDLQLDLIEETQARQATDAVLRTRTAANNVEILEMMASVSRVEERMLTLTGEFRDRVSISEEKTQATLEGLSVEIKNRESTDAGLQAQITASVAGLVDEIKHRESADAGLQAQIAMEIKSRESADTVLQSGLFTGIQATQAMDAVLQTHGVEIIGLGASVSSVDERIVNLAAEFRAHVSFVGDTSPLILEGLSVETKNRETADAALRVQITASMTSLADEVKNRENADTGLQAQIMAEIKNRASADTELQAQITAEIKNRASADTERQAQITAGATALSIETKNRENTDTWFQTQIATVATGLSMETENRENADTGLQTQITTEIKNREHVDTELQVQITTNAAGLSAETKHRESVDTGLQAEIQILTNTVHALEVEMKQWFETMRSDINTLASTQSAHSGEIKNTSDRINFYHPSTPPTKGIDGSSTGSTNYPMA